MDVDIASIYLNEHSWDLQVKIDDQTSYRKQYKPMTPTTDKLDSLGVPQATPTSQVRGLSTSMATTYLHLMTAYTAQVGVQTLLGIGRLIEDEPYRNPALMLFGGGSHYLHDPPAEEQFRDYSYANQMNQRRPQ